VSAIADHMIAPPYFMAELFSKVEFAIRPSTAYHVTAPPKLAELFAKVELFIRPPKPSIYTAPEKLRAEFFSKYDFSETKIDLPPKKSERATLYSSVIKNSDSVQYKLFQHVVNASGKLIDEVKDELVCPISMETIRSYAKEVGYSSVEFFNDYNRTPYSTDSDKIICVLKK
jgi:hypothetical protein